MMHSLACENPVTAHHPEGCSLMSPSTRVLVPLVAVLFGAIAACGGGGGNRQPPTQAPSPEPQSAAKRPTPTQPDAVRLYRQMGLLAEAGDTPFVGSVAFLGSNNPDSTLLVLTVSVPTRALTFVRENERYRASYSATLSMTRASEVVRRFETHHIVRVGSFRETTRSDESVLYQQVVRARPGLYELSFSLRDDAGGKGSSIDATMNVPRMNDGSLSSPIPVYDVVPRNSLDSLPRIVPSPRATLSLGQDTTLVVYIEGYGSGASLPIRASVFGENTSRPVWSDTILLARHGALFGGQLKVPVARLGVGALTLAVTTGQGTDTTKAPVFV